MSKLLVLTGVTGSKSGGILAEYVSQNIDAVMERFDGIRVICRTTSNISNIEKLLPDIEIDRNGLEHPNLKDADTVAHVAGIHSSREIVDAAVENHVRRLILVHTTGIYSKYKAAGEEYRHIDTYVGEKCRENGILLSILRPTMIYGNTKDANVVQFIKMVDKFPIMPAVKGGRYELQPVHYKDLGKAYYDCLMNEDTAGKNYVLSGGEVLTLREMLADIANNLGKRIHFISFPFWFAYGGAWGLYIVSLGKKDFREKVQRLCEPRIYSHEEATRDFGYHPRTFKVGIVDEVREYKNSR